MNKNIKAILVAFGFIALGAVVYSYYTGRNEGRQEAQDYNSSRSNKPSPVSEVSEEDEGEVETEETDAEEGKQEAQDYDSSRSNKPAPQAAEVNDREEDNSSDEDADIDAATGASLEVRRTE